MARGADEAMTRASCCCRCPGRTPVLLLREMRMTGEIAAVVVIEIDREGCCAPSAAGLPRRLRHRVLDRQLVAATGNMALLEDTPGFMRPGARAAGWPRKRRQLCVSMPPPPARAGLCERVFRTRPAHSALYAGRLCGGRGHAAWPRAWRPAIFISRRNA